LNDNKIAVVIATGINGLGAIHSLDRAGFKSVVIYASSKDLSALSSLPMKKILVKDNDEWESNLLSVLQHLEFESPPAIIACSDKAANFLSTNLSILSPKYKQLSPSAAITNMLNDKKYEIEHMEKSLVPIPKSSTKISDLVEDGLLTNLRFPVIIKPRTYKETTLINAKNVILHNSQEWQDFYIQQKSNLDQLVAQEVIQGDDNNLWVCNATFDSNSNMLAAFTFQRLGTMPSHYGVTSIAISKNNLEIKNICDQIGKSLSYTGSAMFEFKFDHISNRYLYIETNPRLGMCNWFDTSCGINNVEMNCLAALGIPTLPLTRQVDEVLLFNVLGDFISRLENSEKLSNIFRLYTEYFFHKKSWPIFSLKDPIPFLYSFSNQSSQLIKRTLRKLLTIKRGTKSI